MKLKRKYNHFYEKVNKESRKVIYFRVDEIGVDEMGVGEMGANHMQNGSRQNGSKPQKLVLITCFSSGV